MTQAKAATVTSALITAGYTVRVEKMGTDNYRVIANSTDGLTNVDAVKSFSDSQAITGLVDSAIFE